MAAIKTEAVVLRKVNFRETSVILDLYTSEWGKVRGVLKGVRTHKSRVAPLAFTAGSHVNLVLYPRRASGLTLLHAPVTVDALYPESRTGIRVWHLLLDLVNRITPERERSEPVFELLLNSGACLVGGRPPEIIFVAAKMKLIRILGYGVELNRCVRCRTEEKLGLFSGRRGGVLCPECAQEEQHPTRISRSVLSVMRYLDRISFRQCAAIRSIPPTILEKINFYLNATLHYHTELKDIWWYHEKTVFQKHH
jgi:DNA repair protein RecO (recombination protein O)